MIDLVDRFWVTILGLVWANSSGFAPGSSGPKIVDLGRFKIQVDMSALDPFGLLLIRCPIGPN